jgi:uncharacterized protein
MSPSRSEILGLLRARGVPKEIISHCTKVEGVAMDLAGRISRNGTDVDLGLISAGALLHDIGRSETHGIEHGVAGAKIILTDQACRSMFSPERLRALARICERHIGAGLPARDAAALGLPEEDFIPTRVEEKIIAHADNLVWNGVLTEEESLRAFEGKHGAGSPVFERIAELAAEIRHLAGEEP